MPEFIDPVLGMKMLVFAKTCGNRSFSIQSVPREAGFSLFWMRSEAVDMNGRIQMQGGKNWILPK